MKSLILRYNDENPVTGSSKYEVKINQIRTYNIFEVPHSAICLCRLCDIKTGNPEVVGSNPTSAKLSLLICFNSNKS